MSDEGSAVVGEAAVLVSRRTARRAAHGLPAERLRDDGYLGPVSQNDASVLQPLATGSRQSWCRKRQPLPPIAILSSLRSFS